MSSDLKVLFLAAEATPFTKVGGLADVSGALPKALRDLGVDVRLMIPRYGNLQHSGLKFERVGQSLPVPVGSDEVRAHLLRTESDGVPVYLIWNDRYFSNRERVYGFNDDPQRFLFFCRAVISALRTLDWTPDLVHANDWHTAAVPVWLDVYGRAEDRCADIATVFTIHNLAYQGECGRLILTFGRMDQVPHLSVEPPGKVNWMAQGIAHADFISTVSSSYAREILTPASGMGLHTLLQEREDRLYGILSGIDTELWNPETDEALTQSFDSDSLNMRAVNKTALQNDLRLAAELNVPLLGMVTRLDGIKGLDLVIPALRSVLEQRDVQFVLLGTGDEQYAEQFRALQAEFPRHIRALIKFDERIARRIYGSADIFLAPSRSEPISLGQMTAMRYGAVPVVRATGGLADTVVDVDAHPDRGTGFVFRPYETSALVNALERALQAYGQKARWSDIQRRAMGRDFSWSASAHTYVDLYRRARAVRQTGDDA
jgi:starch synthase